MAQRVLGRTFERSDFEAFGFFVFNIRVKLSFDFFLRPQQGFTTERRKECLRNRLFADFRTMFFPVGFSVAKIRNKKLYILCWDAFLCSAYFCFYFLIDCFASKSHCPEMCVLQIMRILNIPISSLRKVYIFRQTIIYARSGSPFRVFRKNQCSHSMTAEN